MKKVLFIIRQFNLGGAQTQLINLATNLNKNYFKPKNDILNNYWFTLNDNDLFEYTGRKFSNFIIYETNSRLNFPNPKKITANISNNHLKYSFTWFSLAISIFLIYLYFRKKNY